MSDQPEVSINEFLSRLDAGWGDLTAFISTLTPEQMTVPTDAAGWTVKDHLIHLAVWEDGMNAVLAHESRVERMGVDEATWNTDDFDAINAQIQQQHRDEPLNDVLATLDRVHADFRGRVSVMSTADLLRPYSDFQPGTDRTNPIVWSLVGNTFGHCEEHIPWMQTIVDGAAE